MKSSDEDTDLFAGKYRRDDGRDVVYADDKWFWVEVQNVAGGYVLGRRSVFFKSKEQALAAVPRRVRPGHVVAIRRGGILEPWWWGMTDREELLPIVDKFLWGLAKTLSKRAERIGAEKLDDAKPGFLVRKVASDELIELLRERLEVGQEWFDSNLIEAGEPTEHDLYAYHASHAWPFGDEGEGHELSEDEKRLLSDVRYLADGEEEERLEGVLKVDP